MPYATLPSKPDSPLSYTLTTSSSDVLVVFINGLGLPAVSWNATISLVQSYSTASNFLTYDRYGQGETTARDPADATAADPSYGHDLTSPVKDLDELLESLGLASKKIILVSASIGVHIARLYAAAHPERVSGHLMLDSNMGNIEMTAIWPDPAAPGFPDILGDDFTLEQYQTAKTRLGRMFDSDAKNKEGLDRRNVKDLVPDASTPKLMGPRGPPWLTVAGHDPLSFAEESRKMVGTPDRVALAIMQP